MGLLLALLACPGQAMAQASVNAYFGKDLQSYIDGTTGYYQQGDWESGKGVVDAGIKKYPKSSDLRMLLGKYYYEKRNYDAARYELKKSLEYNGENINAKEILINVEIATERYSSAICYINELLEVNPYWKGLWKKKIEIDRMQGNIVEANRQLKRLCQIYPDDVDLRSTYAYYIEQDIIAKKQEGKYNEAIQLSAELVDADPFNEATQLELINAYIKAGNYSGALNQTEKALQNLPRSTKLMDKKLDILSVLNRYDEILNFLQLKIKEGGNRAYLQRRYDYFKEEAARKARQSDPYHVYYQIFEKDPKNEEAFVYIYNTALNQNMLEEALGMVQKAKAAQGETKDLLLKEQLVYERMGAASKAEQVGKRMYELWPNDTAYLQQYATYQLRQAQAYMADQKYDKAVEPWIFVVQHTDDPDMRRTALVALYNCYTQLGKYEEALDVSNQLVQAYPLEWEWYIKRSDTYGKLHLYSESLNEYHHVMQLIPVTDLHRALDNCDEMGTAYTKHLIEGERIIEALQLVEVWLEINPSSQQGLRYAIALSAQQGDYDRVERYCRQSLNYNANDTYARIKLAEAYNHRKEYKQSVETLSPEIKTYPYNQELIRAHSQFSEDYAKDLIKEKEYPESVNVLDTALGYDPNNKSLKYWKGVAYEKMHKYDSAHSYQKNYEPSPLELRDFEHRLRYLQNTSYKNQLGFYYLRMRLNESENITSVATAEYLHMWDRNTLGGRVNYTGRGDGKGFQGELEWDHDWCETMYTRLTGAIANKYFPQYKITLSGYKAFGDGHELGLGLGYTRTFDPVNMFNVELGYSKTWEAFWLNVKLNNVFIDWQYHYNVSAQLKHFLFHPKSYVTVMASAGSAPDVEIIEYQAYSLFSARNTMVGGGFYHLITKQCAFGLLGNWYHYAIDDEAYQSLFTLNFQLNVYF